MPQSHSSLSTSRSRSHGASGRDIQSVFSSSFHSGSPLAAEALARDLAECSDDDFDEDIVDDETHSSSFMYRRASGVAYGSSRPVVGDLAVDESHLTATERKRSRDAERSLLRDNYLLPPKHRQQSQSLVARIYRRFFSTKVSNDDEHQNGFESNGRQPTETSPLLDGERGSGSTTSDDVEDQWEEAVASGRIHTTWQREAKTLAQYSAPLMVTFVLQYSINVTSIFAVGRIGKMELGAVSLANMSQAITCLAPFQGLATSLDTLCAQAYGSGHKHLVGIQCQRMACFLFTISAPVVVVWCFSESILSALVPEPESARLAGIYLKVMIFSIPGMILFEVGKRFTQAQGLFHATTYVLVIAAPLNIFINWLLVWKLEWGFIGAPIAVVITENLLPILLLLYIRFVDGRQCWGGFSKRALSNWWVMIRLALPGMIMVEAEWLAFEILTLMASRFGAEYLAAQSVLTTLTTISFQIPFPVSIAASTRVANLIGAGLVDAARVTAKVTFVATILLGLLNFTVYSALRYHLPLLFTKDAEVIEIVARVLPLVAVMQIFDCHATGANGLLRGIGRQAIGGPVNLLAYYVISLPISIGLGFGLGWNLEGLWLGVTVGLCLVSIIEYTYLIKTDWDATAREAADRNAAG